MTKEEKATRILTQMKSYPFITDELKEAIETALTRLAKVPEEKKQRRSFKQSMYKYN